MTEAFTIRRRRVLALASVVLGLTLAGTRSASALDLDEARSQGFVGERFDGYVGVVRQGPGQPSRRSLPVARAARKK